ncbi:MAG TPA: HAMP domain-containing sensor histidine kinase [Ktedonobacterales bacterium]|nr:HAMP domain-containing sensor histidine kinase [Ktedonobacterales bacterium]
MSTRTTPTTPTMSPARKAPGTPPTNRRASTRMARLRRWVNGPADPPGAPFAAARRRLIFTSVAVVAIVLAVLTIAIFLYNQRAAREQTVEFLQTYATTGSAVVRDNDGPPHGGDDDGPLVPYSPSSSDTFVVVLDAQGNTISDPDQIEHLGVPIAAAAQPVLSGQQSEATPTVNAHGYTYQLYVTRVERDGQLVGAVVAGTSLEWQQRQEDELLRTLAIIYSVALLLTFLSTVFLTERALRPARLAFIRQRQFATAASHELKTPLAVIRSEAELASGLIGDGLTALRGSSQAQGNTAAQVQVSGPLEEALRETQAATTEVDYMARMVQGMLLLARDTSDTHAHPWSDVDLRTLLSDVTARMRPLAEREGLNLDASAVTQPRESEPTVVLARGDADMLRQLFFGLLENAMRYTPTGGNIRVAMRLEKRAHLLGDHRRHAYISVSDSGVGIAPEHLPHIFEPFYRVVSAARPLYETQHGAGLGLALSQWIVQAHGGAITVESTPGVGTTFTVALPLASE